MEKPVTQSPHVLFEFSPLDCREDIDDKTQKAYLNLKQMIAGKTTKECHESYLKYIAINAQENTEELTMGLLVAILAEQDGQQSRYYRDVATFSKDSLNLFSTLLNIIIIERLSQLKDHSVKQIFWITNQLMKANINTAENVCSNLIRQTAGGDLSVKNLRLVESLLELLIENRTWLINSTSFMVPTTIYTFMRLISDHMGPAQSSLRQREVNFVCGLIREKFLECIQIGRDFLRLLHNIIKIPEFEKLWHDIHNNPRSLHSNCSAIQLLSIRTPRRLVQSRLTFEMERKISFLATQVKFGNQKRYQDWFHKQYLASPESLSLRCDLIRYICTIIHPSNEVLCSDIIPRWAIIGWLLTSCTTSASASNQSRLALFMDWLLYDTKMDNIMNIEPAILVMYYSLRSHPSVTSSLLDFLCRIPSTFSPKLAEPIKAGIKKSLQQILEKRVIQTLTPLFDFHKHDPVLKALIRETFPEFCPNAAHVDNGISHPNSSPQFSHPNVISNHIGTNQNANTIRQADVIIIDQDKIISSSDTPVTTPEIVANRVVPSQDINHTVSKACDQISLQNDDKQEQCSPSSSRDEAKAFSWNGTENANASYSHKQNHDNKNRKTSTTTTNSSSTDQAKKSKVGANTDNPLDEPVNNTSKNLNVASSNLGEHTVDLAKDDNPSIKVIYPFMTVQDLNFKEALNSFEEPVRTILEDLSNERCNDVRCNLMDKLISAVFDNSEQSANSCALKQLGHCMAYLIVDDFATRIFPSSSQDNESLEESIATPFFVLCRSAFSNAKSNWALKPMSLIVAIAKFLEATGFLVLYFLRVTAIVNGSSVSNSYIDFCTTAKRKLSKCLYDDLFMTLTYDPEMFCFLLPSVFGEIAASGSFPVTGNIDLIRLVVSAIDPIYLQELICLCLTGTAKVINKEDVISLISSSLTWESWEQYCVWKLISAQSVPVENYVAMLPKLDTKVNAEAMSCILLNLQKVTEPTLNMLEQLISCECKPNDPFISSILRYWSMKTDVKDLAKSISSLYDSRPSSPQVKRKGQTKTPAKNSSILSSRSERILCHLDSIRQRAPKNKLLAQTEILEMMTQMETLCNENQKKKFADLFSKCTKPTKKQKKMDKEA